MQLATRLYRFIVCVCSGMFVLGVLLVGSPGFSQSTPDWQGNRVTADEMALSRLWLQQHLLDAGAALPFSFMLGDEESGALLARWPCTQETHDEGAHIRHTLRWHDPAGGLEVRLEAVAYRDFPTLEWTLWLKNTGTQDTLPLKDVHALRTTFQRPQDRGYVLHHFEGSHAAVTDYQPFTSELSPGMTKSFAAVGGRPTNGDGGGMLPYFNLDWAAGGAIIAFGWPGQWSASFTRDQATGLTVSGGQQTFNSVLHPGEEVRTPLTVLQFWQGGDWLRAQNIWRRWMRDDNIPRRDGHPLPIQTAAGPSQGLRYTTAGLMKDLAGIKQSGNHYDYWWMDAGWYPCEPDWTHTGTWEVEKARLPNGIREVSDAAHAMGMKTILWFEPERLVTGSRLYTQHKEWVFDTPAGWGDSRLLNLGNAEARQWVTEMVDTTMKTEGIDLYRQDFNIDPLPFWAAADTPDRQGMAEMRHVMGYLALWDELHRRHPNLMIDSCASGGRRNDLETLRRAVPLLRSDEQFNPEAQQNHNYGISFWMPYNGTGMGDFSLYHLRSAYCPGYGTGGGDAVMKKCLAELPRVQQDMLDGDYYPLTEYAAGNTAWMAWQFDVPERNEGIVQAFRRPNCAAEQLTLKLHGLDPQMKYAINNADVPGETLATGKQLMTTGLIVTLKATPSSALFTYQQATQQPAGNKQHPGETHASTRDKLHELLP